MPSTDLASRIAGMRRVEDWGYLLRSIEAHLIGTIDCMEGSAIAKL